MIIITVTICITALTVFALHKGFDGALLWSVIGLLSSIAGWQGKKRQVEKKREARLKCQKSSMNSSAQSSLN